MQKLLPELHKLSKKDNNRSNLTKLKEKLIFILLLNKHYPDARFKPTGFGFLFNVKEKPIDDISFLIEFNPKTSGRVIGQNNCVLGIYKNAIFYRPLWTCAR